MTIETVVVGELSTNCYIVCDGGDCLVIDPGAEPEAIQMALAGRTVGAIFLTHAHFDHIGALEALRADGAPVYVQAADAAMLENPRLNLSVLSGDDFITCRAADHFLEVGLLPVQGFSVEIIHTPGHTPGSVCVRMGDALFSGDTLFQNGLGRTDLPGGNLRTLGQSLKKLLALPAAMAVYPGHGEPTTIGREKQHYDP